MTFGKSTMEVKERTPVWRVVGASVKGASHERRGIENQDAIHWIDSETAESEPKILAIADGHGSAKSFRSAQGATFAVRGTTEILHEFLTTSAPSLDFSAMRRWVEEELPRRVVLAWQTAVADHLTIKPLTELELGKLNTSDGDTARRTVALSPTLAYGSTVLAVAIFESHLLFVQIGDGDILVVAENGDVQRPLAGDARLIANETTSLSSNNAWRDFRVALHDMDVLNPALILVSTDGYANSFRDEANFLLVGSDLLKMFEADGLDEIVRQLPTWLEEASRSGSGDDITVGILAKVCDSSDEKDTNDAVEVQTNPED